MTSTSKGFTLAEVLISVGILAVAMLGMLSLCATGMTVNKKSATTLTAAQVADRQLQRAIRRMVVDDYPEGARETFWDREFPYPSTPLATGKEVVGSNTFSYALYANTLPLPSSVTENRVKRVDIVVWWWSDSGRREGYGRLQQQAFRLVNEEQTSP